MSAAPSAFPADIARLLEAKTVRAPGARAHFLAAVREAGRDGAPFTVGRLRGLMAIEEHFQALLLYDQLEFLRAGGNLSDDEREFAQGVQRICLEAANGFQRFLRHRDEWARSREDVETLFRVTGLALGTIHCFVKWGCFLNAPGRMVPWRQLHALYALAEAEGYSQAPFVLHASQPSFKPSVQSLYLRTLMLDLVNAGSLSRVQLEIADGWFASWCGDYSLDTQYSSRAHLFYLDLEADAGLHLMRKEGHGEAVRYVRTDGLKAQIEEVQAGLRHGHLYAGHGAGAVFPLEEHVALLATIEKLYGAMIAGADNRIEERTHFEDREVEVVVGTERVFARARMPRDAPAAAPTAAMPAAQMVEISPSGMSLTAIDATPASPVAVDPDLQTWRVNDLSSKGYGLLVDRASADAVLLNGLVALRDQERGGWIVGTVVRKLANRVRGEMLAGIEVLAYRPVRVLLEPVPGGATVEALFLPGAEPNGKADALLLRVADFGAGKAFGLVAAGKRYPLRLNRVTRKGADWIKVRFEIDAKA